MILKPRSIQKNGLRGRRRSAPQNQQNWNKDGVVLVDCLPQDSSITLECYANFLDQLKEAIKTKRRREKLTKGILVLHDNAPAHMSNVAAAK